MPLTQMAYIDANQLDSDLEDVADAIRAKSGGSAQLAFPAGFISEIGNIPTGGGVAAVLIGETPVMSSSNNTSISDLCTVDVDGLDFNALLFLSKDKTAFKLLPYFTDTIANTNYGMIYFSVSDTNCYKAPNGTVSFGVAARDSGSVKTLTISHSRMTSTSGNFYLQKPQAFDIYAVKLDPASW